MRLRSRRVKGPAIPIVEHKFAELDEDLFPLYVCSEAMRALRITNRYKPILRALAQIALKRCKKSFLNSAIDVWGGFLSFWRYFNNLVLRQAGLATVFTHDYIEPGDASFLGAFDELSASERSDLGGGRMTFHASIFKESDSKPLESSGNNMALLERLLLAGQFTDDDRRDFDTIIDDEAYRFARFISVCSKSPATFLQDTRNTGRLDWGTIKTKFNFERPDPVHVYLTALVLHLNSTVDTQGMQLDSFKPPSSLAIRTFVAPARAAPSTITSLFATATGKRADERVVTLTPQYALCMALLLAEYEGHRIKNTYLGLSAGIMLGLQTAETLKSGGWEKWPLEYVQHLRTALVYDSMGKVAADDTRFCVELIRWSKLFVCTIPHKESVKDWIALVVKSAEDVYWRRKLLADLQAEVDLKRNELTNVPSVGDIQQRLEDVTEEIALKDEEIANLKSTISKSGAALSKAEAETRLKSADVSSVRMENDKLREQLLDVSEQAGEKDKRLLDLTGKMESEKLKSKAKLEAKDAELANLMSELNKAKSAKSVEPAKPARSKREEALENKLKTEGVRRIMLETEAKSMERKIAELLAKPSSPKTNPLASYGIHIQSTLQPVITNHRKLGIQCGAVDGRQVMADLIAMLRAQNGLHPMTKRQLFELATEVAKLFKGTIPPGLADRALAELKSELV